MKIFLACDHGGLDLKMKISQTLSPEHQIADFGAAQLDPEDDYTAYAKRVCEGVVQEPDSLGILICRSGIGMSIAANKFKGIYAALCFTPEHGIKAREHNNANILCLDSDYGDENIHMQIVKNFLSTKFAGWESRHGRRVNQIKGFEDSNFK